MKKRYSFTLDEKLMEEFQKVCVINGMKFSTRIEVLIKMDLESIKRNNNHVEIYD